MVSAGTSYDTPAVRSGGPRLTLADCFVVIAVGLVATAVAVGLIAQFSIELIVAVAAASAAFIAMMVGHIGLRRADGRRRDNDFAAMIGAGEASTLDRRPVARASQAKVAKGKTKAGAEKASVALNDMDFGNFRPRSPADLKVSPAKPQAADAEAGSIDEMIRRLADDIEAGRKSVADDGDEVTLTRSETTETRPPVPPAMPGNTTTQSTKAQASGLPAADPSAVGQTTPPPIPPAPQQASGGASSPRPPTMVEAATPPATPVPDAVQVPTATAKLAAIADALSDEQLEVCLETINHLEDYRAQHYEVSVRLQLGDGEVLDNDTFIAQTRGTGLLPLLEAVKVSSTKRLAVQMIRRGRAGEFFSAIDGEALSDRQFSEDVDTITGGDPALAGRLVLAFSQSDVRNLTPAQLFTLDSIAAQGFRFSIENINDLDMDFEQLAGRGFVFAKLDADVFLSGLPIGTSRIPAADICQHLGKAGLSLIVGKIEDETARAKIHGFGAVLGQGPLFGAPRPVRADVLKPAEQPARAV